MTIENHALFLSNSPQNKKQKNKHKYSGEQYFSSFNFKPTEPGLKEWKNVSQWIYVTPSLHSIKI